MWHHSETHHELWMTFTLVDEIMLYEFSETNIVYWLEGPCVVRLLSYEPQKYFMVHITYNSLK